MALIVGVGVAGAQQYDFLGIGDGAPQISIESEKTILPPVEGWDLGYVTSISWADLFGRLRAATSSSSRNREWVKRRASRASSSSP